MSTPDANGRANPSEIAATLPFPLLFEQCPLAIVVYDRALRVVASNEAMARLIGVSRSLIDGLHIDDLGDQRHLRALQGALAGETATYESPYQAMRSDVWFWASRESEAAALVTPPRSTASGRATAKARAASASTTTAARAARVA